VLRTASRLPAPEARQLFSSWRTAHACQVDTGAGVEFDEHGCLVTAANNSARSNRLRMNSCSSR